MLHVNLTTVLHHFGYSLLFIVFFLIGDNSIRTEIPTNEYLQVVIYDHMTRRKS